MLVRKFRIIDTAIRVMSEWVHIISSLPRAVVVVQW